MFLDIKNKGIALIAVYFAIVILMILASAFFMQSYSESKQAERHKLSAKALSIAEAGIERAVYDLREDFLNDDEDPSWSDGDINGIVCDPDDADDDNFYLLHQATALAEGSYEVRLRNIDGSADSIWIRSIGTVSGISRTIEVNMTMLAISIWDNVIFAGGGQIGNVINGNVDIRGSVHILGDNLAEGAFAMSLSGTGGVGNNYDGMPVDLRNRVPDLEEVEYEGEVVETLWSEVRVRKGRVDLDSESSTIGDEQETGNAFKETVDGTYVTDGFGGNKGDESVFSDNGTRTPYDLEDIVQFPSMSDDIGDGRTYQQFLRDTSLVVSGGDAAVFSNIRPGDTEFEYTDTGDWDTAANAIRLTTVGNTSHLEIKGIVYIDGNININSQGNKNTVLYEGIGSIVSEGNVGINANFLTMGNNSYPAEPDTDENIIAIMTPGTIAFAGTQRNIAGLFYAETEITSNFQTNVAGTFVTNHFNMGNQVPAIYQVPEIINHLPPGLIGTKPFYVIKTMAWKES